MTVTYNSTSSEFWHGVYLCHVRHPYQRWLTLLAVGLIIFGVVQHFVVSIHYITALIHATIFLFKTVGLYFFVIAIGIYSRAGRPCTETITPERFICMTPDRVSSIPWKNFVQIEQTQEQIVFFTLNRNFFIPRRAFSNLDEASAFYFQAVIYWQTAKGNISTTPEEGVWPPAPRRGN